MVVVGRRGVRIAEDGVGRKGACFTFILAFVIVFITWPKENASLITHAWRKKQKKKTTTTQYSRKTTLESEQHQPPQPLSSLAVFWSKTRAKEHKFPANFMVRAREREKGE